jgi:hypothetical protein
MGTAAHPVLSFILIARFPPSTNPTRRALGAYVKPPKIAAGHEPTVDELLLLDLLTLAEARAKAQEWLRLIGRGVDPAKDVERRRHAEVQRQDTTFGAVFDDFVAEKLAKERKGAEVKRDICNNFLPRWEKLPITDITELNVLAVINAKKKTAPAHARNLLGEIRRMFEWAVDQRVYGLKTNPAAGLKPGKIIGKKKKRDRVLDASKDNPELFALWRTAGRLPYPAGPVYRLLVLTALRLNAVADASWSEFPPAVVRALCQRKKGERIDWTRVSNEPLAWIIPKERMKGEDVDALDFLVPLTPDVLAVLETLPLFKKGDYLFSTTFGKKPVWIGDKIKKDVDARMLRTLKARARQRGDDPTGVTLKPWVNHDIRRTVRSNLSRLKVTEEAREAVLAHARPGIKGTYDVHDYADEKREALGLWAARLRSIVELSPPPRDNVVQLTCATGGTRVLIP